MEPREVITSKLKLKRPASVSLEVACKDWVGKKYKAGSHEVGSSRTSSGQTDATMALLRLLEQSTQPETSCQMADAVGPNQSAVDP